MLLQTLNLQQDDVKKLWPFFIFYFGLFVMLSVGDGISLSLFVNRLGITQLPWAYGLNALLSITLSMLYMRFFKHRSNQVCFYAILGMAVLAFTMNWLFITTGINPDLCYRLLFISQDISNAFIFMHFAVWLQDFFSKGELNRILPIIFAGGRLGGIAGGLLLALFSHWIGVTNLILIYVTIGLVLIASLGPLRNKGKALHQQSAQAISEEALLEETQPQSVSNQIAFWIFASSFTFIICRWFLNYQYNAAFQSHFHSAEEMASFLGIYNMIALWISLLVQVMLVGRMIDWFGLKLSQALYSVITLGIMGLNIAAPSLITAVISRFIENELRLVVRNPITVLMSNDFTPIKRKEVRAILFGVVLPVGTLTASSALVWLQMSHPIQIIAWAGLGIGVAYLVASIVLAGVFREPVSPVERWLRNRFNCPPVAAPDTPDPQIIANQVAGKS